MKSELEAMKKLFNVAWGRVGTDNDRLAVYSELVYNRFEDFVRTSFPLFTSFVEDDLGGILKEFVRREHRSPFLIDVGGEFLDFFVSLKHPVKERYPFLEELLLLEWLEIEVFNAPDDRASEGFFWEESYRLSSTARLLELKYPVHRSESLSAEEIGKAEGRYYLLFYRGKDDEVRNVELTEFVFSFLTDVAKGEPPLEVLKNKDLGEEAEEVRSYLDRFMKELVELKVIVKR